MRKHSIHLTAIGLSLAALMTGAILFTSQASTPSDAAPTSEEISWTEFCRARGYDTDDSRDEVINEFLDTWVGSVEEEHAFNNLPARED